MQSRDPLLVLNRSDAEPQGPSRFLPKRERCKIMARGGFRREAKKGRRHKRHQDHDDDGAYRRHIQLVIKPCSLAS
jgi:hypothetical protein